VSPFATQPSLTLIAMQVGQGSDLAWRPLPQSLASVFDLSCRCPINSSLGRAGDGDAVGGDIRRAQHATDCTSRRELAAPVSALLLIEQGEVQLVDVSTGVSLGPERRNLRVCGILFVGCCCQCGTDWDLDRLKSLVKREYEAGAAASAVGIPGMDDGYGIIHPAGGPKVTQQSRRIFIEI
jgi:hypothetical protein